MVLKLDWIFYQFGIDRNKALELYPPAIDNKGEIILMMMISKDTTSSLEKFIGIVSLQRNHYL